RPSWSRRSSVPEQVSRRPYRPPGLVEAITIAGFERVLKSCCAQGLETARSDPYQGCMRDACGRGSREPDIGLYLATLIVMVPVDLVFLGLVAKGFFTSEVGDMLGEIRPLPAVLFYLLYVVGILVFVSGGGEATFPSGLLYGALLGLFCYATFELTSLSILKHWTWRVAAVDAGWGSLMTAVSATAGLAIACWLTPKA